MSCQRYKHSNLFLPISLKDFVTKAEAFHEAAEHAFGTPCSITYRLFDSPRFNDTAYHEGMDEFLIAHDEKTTFFRTGNGQSILPEMWKKAACVTADIHPMNPQSALVFAWAHIEVNRQETPRKVDLYIQGMRRQAPLLSGPNPTLRLAAA